MTVFMPPYSILDMKGMVLSPRAVSHAFRLAGLTQEEEVNEAAMSKRRLDDLQILAVVPPTEFRMKVATGMPLPKCEEQRRTLGNVPIVLDDKVPADQIEFRGTGGRVLARIENIGSAQ